tara:strand:+ start:490 stop:663 length:174 start_codon:yes stop_codon:yes gene_type:complete
MKVGDLLQYKDCGPMGIITEISSTGYRVYELDGKYEGEFHWWSERDISQWEVISENR